MNFVLFPSLQSKENFFRSIQLLMVIVFGNFLIVDLSIRIYCIGLRASLRSIKRDDMLQ